MNNDIKSEKNKIAVAFKSLLILLIILTVAEAFTSGSLEEGLAIVGDGFASVIGCYLIAEVLQMLHDIRRKLYEK